MYVSCFAPNVNGSVEIVLGISLCFVCRLIFLVERKRQPNMKFNFVKNTRIGQVPSENRTRLWCLLRVATVVTLENKRIVFEGYSFSTRWAAPPP